MNVIKWKKCSGQNRISRTVSYAYGCIIVCDDFLSLDWTFVHVIVDVICYSICGVQAHDRRILSRIGGRNIPDIPQLEYIDEDQLNVNVI